MLFFFFFNDTATTEIYTLSLHDALPICQMRQVAQRGGEVALAVLGLRREELEREGRLAGRRQKVVDAHPAALYEGSATRSEEHTSELQSRQYLVCRLLLEKKKNTTH